MPVYSAPAATVARYAGEAVSSDSGVASAMKTLEAWRRCSQGLEVAAAITAGSMTWEDALTGTPLGMHTRDLENAITAARQRVEAAYTVITPREVTARLRAMWPQCYLSSKDAGEQLIEVTLPVRPASELLGVSVSRERAGEMLRRLLHTDVRVIRHGGVTCQGIPMVTLTLEFPLPAS